MKKIIRPLFFAILIAAIFSSCEKQKDDWTLANTISLGDVSLQVPETYEYTWRTEVKVEVSNGFQGNSVAILKEPLAGRTTEEAFSDLTDAFQVYGTPIESDTTLLAHPTKKLETTILVAPELGGEHTITSFIFIDDNYVYTLEYAWSKEFYYLSLNLMNDMLSSLQIK